MPVTFDGPNKLIICDSGTTTISVADVYSRWKDWVATSDNSKYLDAFRVVGGDPIDAGAGTYVTSYFFLTNGWRVRPQESNHTLKVTTGVLLVDGGGDPFVDTVGSFRVRVQYNQPVRAETVATAGTTTEIAAAVWTHATAVLVAKILRNKKITDPVTGLMTVFDDDGTTPFLTASIYESTNTSQPYRGQGVQRTERLT